MPLPAIASTIVGGLASGAASSLLGGLFGGGSSGPSAADVFNLMNTGALTTGTPLGEANINNENISFSLTPYQSLFRDYLRNIGGQSVFNLGQIGTPEDELGRLRDIARPREDELRSQVRSQIFNQGRLGLGVGGGRVNAQFNPELAALEEGLARADARRLDQARGFVSREEQRQMGNLFNAISGIEQINRQPFDVAKLVQSVRQSRSGSATPLFQAEQRRGLLGADAFQGALNQTFQSDAFGDFFGDLFGSVFGGGRAQTNTGGPFSISMNDYANNPAFGLGSGFF